MFRKLFASPLIRYGASAALVIALILAFPSTRALAGELLNLFRVQRVTVVQVDFTGLEQLDDESGPDISQLFAKLSTYQLLMKRASLQVLTFAPHRP